MQILNKNSFVLKATKYKLRTWLMMHKILNFCDSKRKSRFNYEVKHFLVLYFFNTLIQVYFVRFLKKFVHMNTIFDLFLLLKNKWSEI